MQSKKLETSFGIVSVIESKSTGFPIVFIHGNSLSGSAFFNQLTAPELSHLRVIAPDLPGHGLTGKSDNPSEKYKPSAYVKLVVEVCIKLGAANGVLAGHSLGGHLILNALKHLPDLKGAMIFGTPPLTNPPLLGEAFYSNPSLQLAFKPELDEKEKRILAEAFIKKGRDIPEVVINGIDDSDPLARLMIGKALLEGEGADEIEMIREFGKLVAIIHGESDQLVNSQYFKKVPFSCLWRGAVSFVKDCGHLPQIEQPAAFNELVCKFVKDLCSDK